MSHKRAPRPVVRSAVALGAVVAVGGLLAACSSAGTPVTNAGSAAPSSSAATSAPAVTIPSTTSQTTAASAAPTTGAAGASTPTTSTTATSGCATAKGYPPLVDASITVCPDAAPVGGVVHITIKNCDTIAGEAPNDQAAAGLNFLGPASWLGTGGGGGASVLYTPAKGSTTAGATFTIPATYLGGNKTGADYPVLQTKPGTDYTFTTDPAGACTIHFTVTGP